MTAECCSGSLAVSVLLQDWQEIVALYEKDNSYLVELSSLLVRNVTYEIPSLKKQIAKCQQLQQEYSRKEEEGHAGAAEKREQFYHSCKQYGITVSGRGLSEVGGHLGPLSPGPSTFASGEACLLCLLVPFWSQFLFCLIFTCFL